MPERNVPLVLAESEARQIIADPATTPLVLATALQRALDAQADLDRMVAEWASADAHAQKRAERCVACGAEVEDPRSVRYLRSTALGFFLVVARACRESCGEPERWRALVGADEAEAGRLIAAWAASKAPKERDADA